jgi:2-dehydropantoate 2-reductase
MRSRSIPGNTNSDGESHDIGLQNGMTHLDIASLVGDERTIGNIFVPGIPNRQNDQEEPWFALGGGSRQQYRIENVAMEPHRL